MRHAVIGDVGGHLDGLWRELERLGADPASGRLPDDLTVVQVGDLVHRGPESEAVIDLVDRFLEHGDGRWVQLAGNHEAQYLRHPAFQWRDWISTASADRLRSWWVAGEMVVAAVVPHHDEEALVTHAGLTEEFWRRDLGSPPTAREAAERLNDMAAHGHSALFRDGAMLTGRTSLRAGPLWAEAARELVAGWQSRTMPFSQVHGHSSCYDWAAGAWRVQVPDEVVAATTLDHDRSHEQTRLDGGVLVGIDPDHGDQERGQWHAWVTAGA